MQVYEKINQLLAERDMSKKKFALSIIALEPKSHRTGEVMSLQSIYAYLSGTTVITSDLIPYICEVLDIPEQSLFEENSKVRQRLMHHLAKEMNEEEKAIILKELFSSTGIKLEILNLLEYAPNPMLQKIKKSLLEIKAITHKV